MEDELILADLGVAERRLERLEKDLKKARSADLERERDVLLSCKAALEEGRPLRALDLKGEELQAAARVSVPVGQTAPDRHQPRRSGARRPAAKRRRAIDRAAGGDRPDVVSLACRDRCGRRLRKIELEIGQLDAARCRRVPRRSGSRGIGPRPRHSRQLRSARLYFVLHGRRRRVPRMVDSARNTPRSSPPARSTATSREASSARRSSATTT